MLNTADSTHSRADHRHLRVAEPEPVPRIHAPDTAVHAACLHCQRPIHSHDGKRGWVHTASDTYRCEDYFTWAEPEEPIDVEDRIENAAATALAEGRQQMHAEIDDRLQRLLSTLDPERLLSPLDVRRAISSMLSEVAP